MQPKKILRPLKERMLFGVAAGLANYFDIDPIIVRLIFIVLTIWGGVGLILYIVGIFLIPEESKATEESKKDEGDRLHDRFESVASEINQTVRVKSNQGRGSLVFGIIILLIGILFLFSNFFWWFSWSKMWPIILIIIGLIIIASGRKEK